MTARYDAADALASRAEALARAAMGPGDFPPSLFWFTDPARTPDPVGAAMRLPAGCGVVYRHFGAPEREGIAADLAEICAAAERVFLVAADPELARAVGADGVHWPGWAQAAMRRTAMAGFALNTASAHSALGAAKAARAGADIVFLSPVFASESDSAGAPLGALRAGAIARAIDAPVYALSGVNAETLRRLTGTGVAGAAAVGALTAPEG